MNWNQYPNFAKHEFDCKHTGENKMRPQFLDLIQQIRTTFGRPMIINSGYRHFTHPAERNKAAPGTHYYGIAADIKCHTHWTYDLILICQGYGVNRIGLKQHGDLDKRFIHIDIGDQMELKYPKSFWTYA